MVQLPQLRGQLVCKTLAPEVMFPWIKEEKLNLEVSRLNIFMLNGEDDLVVGKDGDVRFKEFLEAHGNIVELERPKKLAHHMPEHAAPHIKKFFKTLMS